MLSCQISIHLWCPFSAEEPPDARMTFSVTCPFCAIADSYPPLPIFISSSLTTSRVNSDALSPQSPNVPRGRAQVLLSTPNLIAFLDHAPISARHVLLATWQHRVKISDARVREGQAIGAWMGLLSRAIVGVVRDQVGRTPRREDGPDGERKEGERISAEVIQSGEEEMSSGSGVFEGDWISCAEQWSVRPNGWKSHVTGVKMALFAFAGSRRAQIIPHAFSISLLEQEMSLNSRLAAGQSLDAVCEERSTMMKQLIW